MDAAWLSIRVELVSGHGARVWPRPGRVFAASSDHTFAALATAISTAFGRWDLNHLYEFDLGDGTCVGDPRGDWGPEADRVENARGARLSRLRPRHVFVFQFDLGAAWTHLCTVEDLVDPANVFDAIPAAPQPFWGWGDLPDQYGRRWDGDVDAAAPCPADPELLDLPPLRPGWGP